MSMYIYIYNVYLLASSIIVPTQLYLFSPNEYNQMSQISGVTNLIWSSQKASDTVSDTGFWRMAQPQPVQVGDLPFDASWNAASVHYAPTGSEWIRMEMMEMEIYPQIS